MVRTARGAYGRFSEYYDLVYEELVNYAGDVRFLERVFRRTLPARPRDLLDLGCGTGNHDLPLASRGFHVTGLDRSASQLAIARRKARDAGLDVRFVRGDMGSFDLKQSFDAALCMFGAFGYLTTTRAILGCLHSVRRHLRPGGIFVFEFWQTSAVRPGTDWLHRTGPGYELLRLSSGRFDRRRGLFSFTFRFLVWRGAKILDRFEETHTVRTYTVPEMRGFLRRGGFDLLWAYAATRERKSFRPVTPGSFRVMAVARARAHS